MQSVSFKPYHVHPLVVLIGSPYVVIKSSRRNTLRSKKEKQRSFKKNRHHYCDCK